jgi:hypothetical protein
LRQSDRSDHSASVTRIETLRGPRRLFSAARWILRIVSYVLVGLFGWLQLKDISFPVIVNNVDAAILLQFTLVFFYLSFVLGMSFDISLQETVYIRDPKEGRLPSFAYVNAAALLVVAIVLLLTRKNVQYFAAALTVFSVVGIASIFSVQSVVKPLIRHSRAEYGDNFIAQKQLRSVEAYIIGKWVWVRAICLIFLLAIVDVICWVDAIRETLVARLHEWSPAIPTSQAQALLPIFAIAVFLIFGEGWQWLMRFKTKLMVVMLDILGEKYVLTRKPEAT